MLGDTAADRRCSRIGPTAFLLLFATAIPASGQVATISIVDSAGNVGGTSAVAYGPDGLALIAYLDSTNGALKAAHCNDVACTTSVKGTIDGSGNVAGFPSIVFGPDGRGLISYQVGTSIKVAHCADALCASATLSTVDTLAAMTVGTAIALGTDGLAVVAYGDPANDALKVAHCSNADCSAATATSFPGRGGRNASLTIGGDGLPLVACDDAASVHVGHCSNQACTAATFTGILQQFGCPFLRSIGFDCFFNASLATRSDGLGILAYTHYNLGIVGEVWGTELARCTNAACAALTPAPPVTGLFTFALDPALALMPGDLPVVAEHGLTLGNPSTDHLFVTRCVDVACSPPARHMVDVAGTGQRPAVAVSPAGLALVTYFDSIQQDLKAAYLNPVGPPSQISIGDVSVVEGNTGTTAAVFQVQQTGTGSASVNFATVPGSAQSGADYVPTSGTVVFPPGSSSQTVTVQVIGDLLVEPNETFSVVISNPQGGVITDPLGVGTIVNDDAAISIGDVAVAEGNAGTTAAVFQVTKLPTSTAASVDFAIPQGGTATPGVDFVAASGTVVFPPGSTSQTITIQVNGDLTPEADETFFVVLSNPQGASIGDGLGQGTILNDDASEISIGDVTVAEGNTGTTSAVFEIQRTGTGSVTVEYATGGGTAAPGVDYMPASGTVAFPPGSSTQTVTVSVVGDVDVEADETFLVTLSNPQGGVIGDGVGECTIVDDDIAPLAVVTELAHGSRYAGDLAAGPGPAPDVDRFRIAQAAYSSYEVVADGTSGDIQPIELTRTAGDGTTVLQTATPVGVGNSVSLRWLTPVVPVVSHFIRVRSGGCGTDCGPDDVYHLRAYETTLAGARFNDSGSQRTVLLLQNPTNLPVDAAIHFWSPAGALLATHVVTPPLPAKGTLVLLTAQVPGLLGAGGSVTVSHTAPYGALSGKTVALEPSTGFSFDTPLLPKSR